MKRTKCKRPGSQRVLALCLYLWSGQRGNPELIGQSVAQTPGLILKRYPGRFGLKSLGPCRTRVRPSCLGLLTLLVSVCSWVKPLHFTHSNSTLASINNHLWHTGPTHCDTRLWLRLFLSELKLRTKEPSEPTLPSPK